MRVNFKSHPILCGAAHNPILCAISHTDVLSVAAHNLGMSHLARDPKQIGNVIRRARRRQGMRQGELGAKAGIRLETVSLLEAGNEVAKLETIQKVLVD
jgi:HTH-type transcriptional regulator/antitoxin HipB